MSIFAIYTVHELYHLKKALSLLRDIATMHRHYRSI